jgi:hypothetical protein
MDLDDASSLKQTIADQLEAVRHRSLALLDPVPEPDLIRQHSPIMSPLVWDLAHVGNYEELWLLEAVAGLRAGPRSLDDIYDAFRHSRADRVALPLLGPAEARAYIAGVRDKALDVLDKVEFVPEHQLLGDAYVYGMVVQHEHQHDETMLATLQLMEGDGYRPQAPMPPRGRRIELNNWDHSAISLPFSRFAIVIAAPIRVAAQADDGAVEQARRAVEDGLNGALQRAQFLAAGGTLSR